MGDLDAPTATSVGFAELLTEGPLSVLVLHPDGVATYALPEKATLTIGRAGANDIQIDDNATSREHATLTRDGERILFEDLDSANGSRVTERRVPPRQPTPVGPGQVIEVGSTMIIVQRFPPRRRQRKLHGHAYFEERLEQECEQVRPGKRELAVLRVRATGDVSSSAVQEALGNVLRPADLIAAFAPGEYELLLIDTSLERAERISTALLGDLARLGLDAQIGLAGAPANGRTPDVLLSQAASRLGARGELKPDIVVLDPAIKELCRVVERVAQGAISVMLLGETGVGKEVFAERVHRASPRRNKPFVKINCAALSETLLESEVFGHEKGAFTGATSQKIGLIESAHGGTVFLDELGEMPASLQAKLLRVIEQKQVVRVGSVKPIDVDVRFVSATNKDLEAEVLSRTFRQDLYFRLNGIALVIPPLRQRAAELMSLAETFLRRASEGIGAPMPPALGASAIALLESYEWPGNIRELKNMMERAVLLCTGDTIEAQHLSVDKMTASWAPRPAPVAHAATEDDEWLSPKEREERDRIARALEECVGNQTRAAEMLGIPRRTFTNLLAKYKFARPRKPGR